MRYLFGPIHCGLSGKTEGQCTNVKCVCHKIRRLIQSDSRLNDFIVRKVEEETQGEWNIDPYRECGVGEIVVNGWTRKNNISADITFRIEGSNVSSDDEIGHSYLKEVWKLIVNQTNAGVTVLSHSSHEVKEEWLDSCDDY